MVFKKGHISWMKGKKGYNKGKKNPFYGKHHTEETKKKISDKRKGKYLGKKNPHWKGGKIIVDGYKYIYKPQHPHITKDGYVLEHRLVMEKKLGRFLNPKEIVHHINHKKLDNRLENLMLLNGQGEHNHHHPKHRNNKGQFI